MYTHVYSCILTYTHAHSRARVTLRYNGKPVIINKTGRMYGSVDEGYVEMGINVHKFNLMTLKALSSNKGKVGELVAKIGFIIQGETDKELPETMFGAGEKFKPLYLIVIFHISVFSVRRLLIHAIATLKYVTVFTTESEF